MESTRPIRALMRGLDALTVLNMRDGATVSEVAHEIRLPRTTVYRILETLCNAGFVFRDEGDDRYRLTLKVRALSGGFDDEAWVKQIAKPLIHELCRDIVWPIALSTPSGGAMIGRETTDHASPLATDRLSAGLRAPMLGSAAGLAYLAFCPAPEREAIIDILARSSKDEDALARPPQTQLQARLSEIKSQGYAATSSARRSAEEMSLGVPVLSDRRVLGCLCVRFATAAVPLQTAVERFLPKLRQCAARISLSFSEQQVADQATGAQRKAAPQAAD
ncbi:MAG: helix-turn-helix domain-containing protein [Steroidobacteraceae bacterium]